MLKALSNSGGPALGLRLARHTVSDWKTKTKTRPGQSQLFPTLRRMGTPDNIWPLSAGIKRRCDAARCSPCGIYEHMSVWLWRALPRVWPIGLGFRLTHVVGFRLVPGWLT